MPHAPLIQIVTLLQSHYGAPPGLEPKGPFEMVLWEIVAYLADDATRTRAFRALKTTTDCDPRRILDTPLVDLEHITRMGGSIAWADRAERLHTAARLVLAEFDGDLASVLPMPLPKAKRALMKFPMTGEPGAEKILLLCGAQAVLALDSNGLRVMQRLGFGVENKSYSVAYRQVREAVLEEGDHALEFLQRGHKLLRLHGQSLCKATHPKCLACPLNRLCLFPGKHSR
jgi:endonuclease III